MKTIHKFTLPAKDGIAHIDVRKGAILSHVNSQGNEISFWYEVDTHEEYVREDFMILHTGDEFDKELYPRREYVGTVLFDNGAYVLHVYRIH